MILSSDQFPGRGLDAMLIVYSLLDDHPADDRKLIQVCHQVDIAVENPIDVSLRRQMASWESENLPQKGLPRILRRIHQWLCQNHQQAAEDFWSQTGGGSHLP